jgi:methylmalonyl-CoA mutase cobalamin-binding subunit
MSDAEDGAALASGAGPSSPKRHRAVIATVQSDSHMWNLVYIELVLREGGWDVNNLGACTPAELVVETCLAERPDMLVVSSVNGHGHIGGRKLIGQVRARPELDYLPVVIGGKLGTLGANNSTFAEPLLSAGYSAVFTEGDGLTGFTRFIESPRRPELVA